MKKWIWQKERWPHFTWAADTLLPLISRARLEQGKLLAKVNGIGFELSREADADILTEEAMKTSEIEGEVLNRESVRSSVAKHLGLSTFGLPEPGRAVDGLVDVLIDATKNYSKPLTAERLKSWQAALFPTGRSGLFPVQTGEWRTSEEPMQVVSGGMGQERVHFEAVPSRSVDKEMQQFLAWWELSKSQEDGLVRTGIAHFYFVTIHPFEDGNGRIARALTDMALAQDEKIPTRFYSLSSQIMKERKQYYDILEQCQKGDLDITAWLSWFLGCYTRALDGAVKLVAKVLAKATFWQHFGHASLNERQRKVVNLLLTAGIGGFERGLTTRKYVSIAKASRATAFREIDDLVKKGLLVQNPTKGRSTSYDLNWAVCLHPFN
ncbi:MAG: Fic family protein [Verrucomicrobiota bacterium]|nr:Fic family protein [Verrucomicrobiota bacterium]